MPFEPGHTLSQGERKKPPVTELITRILVQESHAEPDKQRLRRGLEKLFDIAETGDLQALTFIRDTVQGKPAQSVTVSGDDEKPLISIVRTIVMHSTQIEHDPLPQIEIATQPIDYK